MKSSQPVIDLVAGFVDKSGGIEKVLDTITAMKGVKAANDITGFVQRIGNRPEGAQQLFAAALLGFTLAALVYDARSKQAESN